MSIELFFALVIGFFAIAINSIYYQDGFTFARALDWMIRYFTFGNPYFLWLFAFIYLLFIWHFYLLGAHLVNVYLSTGKKPSDAQLKQLLSYLLQPIYLLAPLALVMGPLFTLLGNMSHELRFTRVDELFAAADFAIFGRYPFLWLPQALQSDWIINVLQDAYMSLALLMSATLGILYLKNKTYFRWGVLAFLISLAVSYPFFYLFPCQDPGNYFLRNVRQRELPVSIKEAIIEYKPPLLASQIITRIEKAETTTDKDNQVPVSCFPSMHAVWSYFIVYFLAVVSLWSLIITIPLTIIVLTGGIYFAQHYFVDYVIALPLAVISIIGAVWLLRLEALWKKRAV